MSKFGEGGGSLGHVPLFLGEGRGNVCVRERGGGGAISILKFGEHMSFFSQSVVTNDQIWILLYVCSETLNIMLLST